jgi:tRNA (adenine22-N1)-methyltransferase
VAALVRPGRIACDIGSDHGLLACALVRSGICPRVYACDINESPLASTRRAIEEYGLSDRVHALLSDGLFALRGKAVEDVIVAGMGGDLIASILEAAPWIWKPEASFVLQPMSKDERLREWLCVNGFHICEERAVLSGRFAYAVLARRLHGTKQCAGALFAWTGKIWDNRNRDEAGLRYLPACTGISRSGPRGPAVGHTRRWCA